MAAYVSETGADGAWERAGSVDAPRKEGQTSFGGAALLDLAGRSGRYVRLEIETRGEGVRMGEVRIMGWPR